MPLRGVTLSVQRGTIAVVKHLSTPTEGTTRGQARRAELPAFVEPPVEHANLAAPGCQRASPCNHRRGSGSQVRAGARAPAANLMWRIINTTSRTSLALSTPAICRPCPSSRPSAPRIRILATRRRWMSKFSSSQF